MADQKRLVPCPTCGNPCSPRAAACPKCGEPLLADDLQSLEDSYGDWQGARGKVENSSRGLQSAGTSGVSDNNVQTTTRPAISGTDLVGDDEELFLEQLETAFNDWEKSQYGTKGPPRNPDCREYHGTPLVVSEHAAMVDLESFIGRPIPTREGVAYNTFGFTAVDGHIVALGLYDRQLTTLPESFQALTSVRELSLAANNFSTFPGVLLNLIALRILRLDDNSLSLLPGGVGNLRSLEELFLSNNKLLTLPDNLLRLEALRVIVVDPPLLQQPVTQWLRERGVIVR